MLNSNTYMHSYVSFRTLSERYVSYVKLLVDNSLNLLLDVRKVKTESWNKQCSQPAWSACQSFQFCFFRKTACVLSYTLWKSCHQNSLKQNPWHYQPIHQLHTPTTNYSSHHSNSSFKNNILFIALHISKKKHTSSTSLFLIVCDLYEVLFNFR